MVVWDFSHQQYEKMDKIWGMILHRHALQRVCNLRRLNNEFAQLEEVFGAQGILQKLWGLPSLPPRNLT